MLLDVSGHDEALVLDLDPEDDFGTENFSDLVAVEDDRIRGSARLRRLKAPILKLVTGRQRQVYLFTRY